MRYITGQSAELKAHLMERIAQALKDGGDSALILMVPEQYTLQAELDVVDALDLKGSFRLQVLSPARLTERIFEAAGRPQPVKVDDMGRSMLMYAALKKLNKELSWYRGAERRKGFSQMAVREISRFKQAGLNAEDLRELAGAQGPGALGMKLNDLAILFEAYEQAMSGRFSDGEDQAAWAAQRAPKAGFLRGARVFVYGFDLISPNLATLLLALEETAQPVDVLMVLEDQTESDLALYLPVQNSLARLGRRAVEKGFSVSRTRVAPGRAQSRPRELAFFEENAFSFDAAEWPHKPRHIALAALGNPEEECMRVAARIRLLAQEKGWRYRDMALAVRDLEGYRDALERAFQLFEVPLFLESSRPAMSHPLARYLLGALKLVSQGWPAGQALSVLKSGYAPLDQDGADRLENYALEHNLRGGAWKKPLQYGLPEEAQLLEPLRAAFAAPLAALESRARDAKTLKAVLEAVFAFLEESGCAQRLNEQADQLIQMGMRAEAAEGVQVWNRIMGALDQMAALMGEEPLTLGEVASLMEQALSASLVKALPQSGDAVTGGSIQRFRSRPLQAVFLLGMDDAPPMAENELLQPEEKKHLEEQQRLFLGMDFMEMSALQKLSLKNLIALARQSLYVSYPRGNREGEARSMGEFVSRVLNLFPELKEQSALNMTSDNLLSAPQAALETLSARLSAARKGERLTKAELNALCALAQNPETAPGVARLAAALRHQVASPPLSKELARAVYGEIHKVSVSRLEQYERCPFAHYVRYGLEPVEIKPFEISPPDEGSFFHSALEGYLRELMDLSELPGENEARARMDQLVDQLFSSTMDSLLKDSSINRAQAAQMRRKARGAAWALTRQLKGAGFKPCAVEMNFGSAQPKVTLRPESGPVALAGIIDRVDVFQDGGVDYLRIIDYKRGQAELSLERVYAGLQLQLLLYLAAALMAHPGEPGGVFYFVVDEPLVEESSMNPETVERTRTQETRLRGLMLNEEKVIRAMGQEPGAVVRGARFKKDGGLASDAPALSREEFSLLMNHALRAAERAMDAIRSGDTRIAPAMLSDYTACKTCDLKPICQFDEGLPGADYCRHEKLSREQVMSRLKEEESPR